MTSQHSKNHVFLTGKESSYATAVSTTKDWGLVQSVTPTDKRTVNKNYSSGDHEVQDITMGILESGFDVELMLQHGRPLEYVFGSVSHAQTSSDWKHSFTIASTIPSFTTQHSFNSTNDSVFEYAGCKVNDSTISVEKDGQLMLKSNVINSTVDDSASTASSAVISSLKPLHFKHFTLKTGSSGSETSPGKVQKWDLAINRNTERVTGAGAFVTEEAVEQNVELTFTFDMTFENTTEYNRFLGGANTSPQQSPASFSAVFQAHNGVTLGSGRREFYTQLAGANYEEVGTPMNVGEIVIQSFNGVATGLGASGAYYVDNISSSAF